MKFLSALNGDIFFEIEFADTVSLIEIYFLQRFLMVTPD